MDINAIPKFTGVVNPVAQNLPDIHSLFDSATSGRTRNEERRDGTDGRRPGMRDETPRSRPRAQSEVRRSLEGVEGTPSKRIRSASVASSLSPDTGYGLRQVAALLGSPEKVTRTQPRSIVAGMGVEDVQMDENSPGGRSPAGREVHSRSVPPHHEVETLTSWRMRTRREASRN